MGNRRAQNELLLAEPEQSLALFEAMLDSTPVGGGLYRADGCCVAISAATALYTGGDPKDLLRQNFRELASWRDSGMLDAAEQALETGEAHCIECRGTSTFERPFWFRAHFARLDLAGERYLTLHFWDISAEREAEQERGRRVQEAMREVEQRFALLAERVDQVFWMSTPGIEEMLYISPAYERVWGRSCASLYEAPQSFIEAIHPDDRERITGGVEGHANGEWEHEYRIVQPDGAVRWIRDRGTRLADAEGELVGMCGTASDITDLKQTEQELRGTVRALARARRDLEQFAYAAADDMQAPLLEMRDRIAEMRRGGDSRVEPLDAPLARLGSMLGDVMEYVALTDSPDPPAPRDLGQCARMAMGSLKGEIEVSGARVSVGDLPTLPADGQQLVRLFQLLLSNALVHGTEAGGRIEIDAERRDGDWVVRVRDRGQGIDPAHHELVFHMFKRVPGAEGVPGTGAGLAIARRIVELHGGRIWVESTPGQGAGFLFTIPDQPIQLAGWTG